MNPISIFFTPTMRYETAGDYLDGVGETVIQVMKQECEDYEFLIAMHELIEWYLTRRAGIPEPEILKFDLQFKGKNEPGDSPKAPYRKQHKFATQIEKKIAKFMGIDWNTYSNNITIYEQPKGKPERENGMFR